MEDADRGVVLGPLSFEGDMFLRCPFMLALISSCSFRLHQVCDKVLQVKPIFRAHHRDVRSLKLENYFKEGQIRLQAAAEALDISDVSVAAIYYCEAGDLFFAIRDFDHALFAFNMAVEAFRQLEYCKDEELLVRAMICEVEQARMGKF